MFPTLLVERRITFSLEEKKLRTLVNMLVLLILCIVSNIVTLARGVKDPVYDPKKHNFSHLQTSEEHRRAVVYQLIALANVHGTGMRIDETIEHRAKAQRIARRNMNELLARNENTGFAYNKGLNELRSNTVAIVLPRKSSFWEELSYKNIVARMAKHLTQEKCKELLTGRIVGIGVEIIELLGIRNFWFVVIVLKGGWSEELITTPSRKPQQFLSGHGRPMTILPLTRPTENSKERPVPTDTPNQVPLPSIQSNTDVSGMQDSTNPNKVSDTPHISSRAPPTETPEATRPSSSGPNVSNPDLESQATGDAPSDFSVSLAESAEKEAVDESELAYAAMLEELKHDNEKALRYIDHYGTFSDTLEYTKEKANEALGFINQIRKANFQRLAEEAEYRKNKELEARGTPIDPEKKKMAPLLPSDMKWDTTAQEFASHLSHVLMDDSVPRLNTPENYTAIFRGEMITMSEEKNEYLHALNCFLKSDGHRKMLLDKLYTGIGFGYLVKLGELPIFEYIIVLKLDVPPKLAEDS